MFTGGVCDRTFRRYINRHEEAGLEGLIDKRLDHVSDTRAPADEVLALKDDYKAGYSGWSVKHYYSGYRRSGGKRSDSWVKKELQGAGLVQKAKGRGKHHKRTG